MIFVKNPEKGKVKTRLAVSVGETMAYRVYVKLLRHTIETAEIVAADREIWYSSFIDNRDGFSEKKFRKKLQRGNSLGRRMEYAFNSGFENRYRKIVIIGSDCPGISSSIIKEAFNQLNSHQAVIGPSEDGGYYLLGMNKFYPSLFRNIEWSTEKVFESTVSKFEQESIRYAVLPELNDIDTIQDLGKSDFL